MKRILSLLALAALVGCSGGNSAPVTDDTPAPSEPVTEEVPPALPVAYRGAMARIPEGSFLQGDESGLGCFVWLPAPEHRRGEFHPTPWMAPDTPVGTMSSLTFARPTSAFQEATVWVKFSGGADSDVLEIQLGRWGIWSPPARRYLGAFASGEWNQITVPAGVNGATHLMFTLIRYVPDPSHPDLSTGTPPLIVVSEPRSDGVLLTEEHRAPEWLNSYAGEWTGEPDERPLRTAFVDEFFLGETPVTHDQYANVLSWALNLGFVQEDDGIVRSVASDPRDGTPWASVVLAHIHPAAEDGQLYRHGSTFRVRNVSGHPSGGAQSMANHPMTHVSWHGALFYAWALNEMAGGEQTIDPTSFPWGVDMERPGHRLPTEAEWEKASRGGYERARHPWWTADLTTHRHPNGTQSNWPGTNAWWGGEQPPTTPVTQFPPNTYGLFDLVGNVRQWCLDVYDPNAYEDDGAVNPRGPDFGWDRVTRGSSIDEGDGRVSLRSPKDMSDVSRDTGFRVAYSLLFSSDG